MPAMNVKPKSQTADTEVKVKRCGSCIWNTQTRRTDVQSFCLLKKRAISRSAILAGKVEPGFVQEISNVVNR